MGSVTTRRRGLAATLAAPLVFFAFISGAWAQSWSPGPAPEGAPSKATLDEAKERYKKGLKLYEEEGDVEAALIELERSYDLAPNFKILYNIGQVARTKRDYVVSLRAFERYLADGGKDVPKPRREEVEKELAALRTFVATLDVVVNVEGAQITLDDAPIGKSPLTAKVLVNAGKHTLVATKDTLSVSKVVTVAGGDAPRVDLELTAPAPAAPPPAPVPEPTPAPAPPPAPAPAAEPPPVQRLDWLRRGRRARGDGGCHRRARPLRFGRPGGRSFRGRAGPERRRRQAVPREDPGGGDGHPRGRRRLDPGPHVRLLVEQ